MSGTSKGDWQDTPVKEVTSFKGEFQYPYIIEPAPLFEGQTEERYRLNLAVGMDVPGVRELKDKIDAMAAETLEAAKAMETSKSKRDQWETRYLPYKMELNEETEEETGRIIFKFSKKASGTNKNGSTWTASVPVFDSKGKAVPKKGLSIWSGTIGKVAFYINPYSVPLTGASVSLKLSAVQIIKLVSGGPKDAEDYGFEAEEEGYTVPDEESFDVTDMTYREPSDTYDY